MRVACHVEILILKRVPNSRPEGARRQGQTHGKSQGEAQSRSRTAQSMFSPLSVTREREKTDEGEAQTETEAPERPQSRVASLLDIKEGQRGRRGPEPARGAQRRQRR